MTGVSALVAEVALSGLEQILVAIALAALGGIGLISRTKYNRWTSSKKRVERENLSKIEATQTFLLGTLKLLVNAASDSSFKDGRIMIQSEGAEIYFRRIELQPLQ